MRSVRIDTGYQWLSAFVAFVVERIVKKHFWSVSDFIFVYQYSCYAVLVNGI